MTEQFQPPPDALDTQWYSRFEKPGAFQGFEYLEGDKSYREQQKHLFLSGEVNNPTLDYPKLDIQLLDRREEELLALKYDVRLNEPNQAVKLAYQWRLNEKLAELRMLKAAASGNARKFRRYTEFIYGKPSDTIFAYTVNSIRKRAETTLGLGNQTTAEASAKLLELLPTDMPEPTAATPPTEETVKLAQGITLHEVGDLVSIPLDKERFEAPEIQAVFSQSIQTLKAEGWQVTIATGSKSGITVNQETRKVEVPATRMLVVDKLRKLIAHEIGTHVARRINGERSKLKLLGLGLDRYEKGDEGVATLREQAIEGKVDDFAGFDGYLAIGLAYGLDGTPRNFREVFQVLQPYYYLKEIESGTAPETAITNAQTKAWNRCVRTFRGTPPDTTGVCYTKDMVYREGNIGAWEVVSNNPEEMYRFSIGQYDPANERHIWLLTELGIEDEDLELMDSSDSY